MTRMPAQLVAVLGFTGCVIGTFMPWAQAGNGDFYSKAGTDTLGIIALPIAAVGAFVILTSSSARASLLATICAAAIIGVGVTGIIGVHNGISGLGFANDLLSIIGEDVKVGMGLYVLIGGAVIALLACLAHSIVAGLTPQPSRQSTTE